MSTEKDRMRDLVKMFEKKDEIFTESKKDINEDVLSGEYRRLKDLASGSKNADFKENFAIPNDWNLAGKGMSVNSLVDNLYNNPAVSFKPIKQPLKSEEAFEIAIKRALESGAPINNMDFYEEVNWSLAQLGFPAKSPLDIKNKIASMISNKDRD